MPCLHGFKLLFNEFTQGVLKDIFELPTRPKQRIFAAGGAVLACAQLWQHPNLQPFYRIAAREGGYFESLRRLRIGQSPQVLQNILAFAACTEDERRTARKAAEKLWLPQGSTGSKPSWGFASSVDLPFVARMRMGMHLDDYMSQHERKRQMLRDNIEQKSRGLWNPPDNDLVAGKYRYIAGNESASAQSIASLLAVSLEDGLPPVRWKNADLWESRRGNEFLPRCYMCRGRIDPSATCAERPRVCGSCEALNAEKLQQVADLRGKTCVVTGGRVNIGYATALRLLRNGATVAVTSRFPRDCLRRYGREEDAGQWLPRLSVYGADFRSVPSVAELGKTLAAAFPRLDVLVNNAAQTVRRPSTHFAELVKAEQQPLEQRLEARLMQQADLKSWDRLEPGLEPLAAEAASEAGRASAEDGPGEQMPVEEVKET
ncbi:unnamed protein product [Effrenium voratum]|nr:unnamed protein product [Effrenium voratum]